MKILVTGSEGFIGAHLVNHFRSAGYRVIALDRKPERQSSNQSSDFYQIDLSHFESVKELALQIGELDAILHFAGQSSAEQSMENPLEDLRDNYFSTVNLVESFGVEPRYFFASSMAVYGDSSSLAHESDLPRPVSNYGLHKRMSEKFLLGSLESHKICILRLFNIYGPGQDLSRMNQGMVSIYLSMAHEFGQVAVKGPLTRIWDLVYIDDLVQILDAMLTSDTSAGTLLNVSSGQTVSVEQIVEIIFSTLGFTSPKISELGPTRGDVRGFAGSTCIRELTCGVIEMLKPSEGILKFIEHVQLAGQFKVSNL